VPVHPPPACIVCRSLLPGKKRGRPKKGIYRSYVYCSQTCSAAAALKGLFGEAAEGSSVDLPEPEPNRDLEVALLLNDEIARGEMKEAAEKSSVDLPGPELRHDLEMAHQEMEVVEDEIASGKRK